jgi:hypothetical protein
VLSTTPDVLQNIISTQQSTWKAMETSMAVTTTVTTATMDKAAVILPTPEGDTPRDKRGWGEDSGGGDDNDDDDDKNKGK